MLETKKNNGADKFLHRLYYTVWLRAIQQLVPDNLIRSGISSING